MSRGRSWPQPAACRTLREMRSTTAILVPGVAVVLAACSTGSPPSPTPGCAPVAASPVSGLAVPAIVAAPVLPGAGASPAAPAPPADAAPPAGYVSMRPLRVAATPEGAAVLLVDAGGTKVVPIFIGDGEALSIHLRLAGQPAQRPLTHDLLDSMLRELQARLVAVRVDRIDDGVFIGTVVLAQGTRTFALDARPSDAIALAAGRGLPIWVAPPVLAEAGLGAEALDAPPAPEPQQRL